MHNGGYLSGISWGALFLSSTAIAGNAAEIVAQGESNATPAPAANKGAPSIDREIVATWSYIDVREKTRPQGDSASIRFITTLSDT